MQRKDEATVRLAQAIKAARTAIRLKHSLLADEEINEVLPEIEAAFNRALSAGKPFALDVSSVFKKTELKKASSETK